MKFISLTTWSVRFNWELMVGGPTLYMRALNIVIVLKSGKDFSMSKNKTYYMLFYCLFYHKKKYSFIFADSNFTKHTLKYKKICWHPWSSKCYLLSEVGSSFSATVCSLPLCKDILQGIPNQSALSSRAAMPMVATRVVQRPQLKCDSSEVPSIPSFTCHQTGDFVQTLTLSSFLPNIWNAHKSMREWGKPTFVYLH